MLVIILGFGWVRMFGFMSGPRLCLRLDLLSGSASSSGSWVGSLSGVFPFFESLLGEVETHLDRLSVPLERMKRFVIGSPSLKRV